MERRHYNCDGLFNCLDCGRDTGPDGLKEYSFMLKNEVWLSIVPGGRGMLCREHMEKRLGRPLTPSDMLGGP